MNRVFWLLLVLCFGVLALGCGTGPTATNTSVAGVDNHEELTSAMTAIEPFFRPIGKPQQHDWLATFKEPGQTFDEYVASNPTLPTHERSVIYIQPLGRFSPEQTKIIKVASEYLGAFYGLNVIQRTPKPLPAKLAEPDQRMIDYPAHRQIRTGWVMDAVLKPALPQNAAALIAFTNEDLYSDSSMYFVFGQASLDDRVGVWSLYRLDDHADLDGFIARTLKIAAHEVGHMFSMRHCTKYECVMSGTNHLAETDRRPIDACPECMAKIAWMRKEPPDVRYERLAAFAKRNKLKEVEADFERKLDAVKRSAASDRYRAGTASRSN